MGIVSIAIPVPLPLKWVNSYLLGPENGPWLIVDAGMDTPEARDAWGPVIQERRLRGHTIGIYLTHYHPDHTGIAAWLSRQVEAPVYMMAPEVPQLFDTFGDGNRTPEILTRYFVQHGMGQGEADLIARDHQTTSRFVHLPARSEVRPVQDGHVFTVEGDRWAVVWTPGHTDGQGLLWNPESGTLVSGDHILPRITPNISRWPGRDPNPLLSYLTSLQGLHTRPLTDAYPAHGGHVPDVHLRIAELLAHHRERLLEMWLACQTPVTAYDVSRTLFRKDLTPHQLRFAVGETLAHLEYLVARHQMERLDESPVRYRAIGERPA